MSLHNTRTVTEFFNTDYVNFSSYDNIRKICSLVDGQKNSSRKILHTILEKNIKEKIKVSQLGSKVAEFAAYLHGNLDGVIVNLAQDFPGSNNIPLLQKKGNFGTRFAQEASASRYIYAYGTPEFFKLFNKDDTPILKHQTFEGAQIEPMFFVPALPIVLINGSEGVSSGFAQKILPRDPKEICDYLVKALKNPKTKVPVFKPFFNGFTGTVEQGDNPAQWLIKGVLKRLGINKVQITEVPIGYDLRGYLSVLDDLEDKGVIQGYKDKSEDDKFLFEVQVPSKSLKEWDDEELLNNLKLIKKVTENYTVLDENNKIGVCESVEEILMKYITVKLECTDKRKEHIKAKLEEEIRFDYSKYIFIKMIVDGTLKIAKRKKDDIVKNLKEVEHIIPRDDSYDYLFNLNLLNLTEERMQKLEEDIKLSKTKLDILIKKSAQDLWGEEL